MSVGGILFYFFPPISRTIIPRAESTSHVPVPSAPPPPPETSTFNPTQHTAPRPPSKFNTEEIRKGFICRVYSILSVQLLFTVACVSLFAFYEPSRQFAEENVWLTITATIIGFSALIVISCCEGVRHTSPHNFIYLAVSTVALSYVVGACTVYMNPMLTLRAVGLTAIVVIGLMVYALQTKWEFTFIGAIVWVFALLFVSVDAIIGLSDFGRSNVTASIVSGICIFLFAVFLIYDVYMIMEGERDAPYQLSPDEYVSGAVILYMDIIWLFMILLKLLSMMTKDKNRTRGRNVRRTNLR